MRFIRYYFCPDCRLQWSNKSHRCDNDHCCECDAEIAPEDVIDNLPDKIREWLGDAPLEPPLRSAMRLQLAKHVIAIMRWLTEQGWDADVLLDQRADVRDELENQLERAKAA
jgi:hypothetical protein